MVLECTLLMYGLSLKRGLPMGGRGFDVLQYTLLLQLLLFPFQCRLMIIGKRE